MKFHYHGIKQVIDKFDVSVSIFCEAFIKQSLYRPVAKMHNNWGQFGFSNVKSSLNIEQLKQEVGKYFPFYDVRFDNKTVAFFCRIDKTDLEAKFDKLRRSLSEKGYIPMLRNEHGESIIYVVKKPKKKLKPIWLNYLLLVSVIITTVITGSLIYTGNFAIWNPELGLVVELETIFKLENLFFGAVFFALPLLTILIVHEMGHYYISKKHGIATSLPFFIPIPPILPYFNIGTFGALISSRDPMPDKKALFDVGLSGPLCGFLVAIPVTIIGIMTADVVEIPVFKEMATGETIFGSSLLIQGLIELRGLPAGYTIDMNPILFAGWVSLLITSINLLPAGQLDGGHIFRAIMGNKQKYAGIVAVVFMILTGWLFFAFFIIFAIGLTHPPPLNDDTELDFKRQLLFIVAIAILVLCFIPDPFIIK